MSSRAFSILGRGTAIAAALLLIAVPAGSHAGDDAAALESTKREIARIRKSLARAKGEAAAIQQQVDALDRQMSRLTGQISDGTHDISTIESDIRTAEAQITELEGRYLAAHRASNERARRIYKAGPADSLTRLLEARSIGQFARLLVWWEVAAELDGRTMLNATRLRGDLAERKEDLSQVRRDLEGRKSRLVERRALLSSAKKERDSALQSVKTRIDENERHIRELERESRELTARLRGASLSQSATGDVSTSGFIWPLNARVSSEFGNRRGGFHAGIDIDGNTGDPIRSAKSGTVVGVQCGSGYGICTILDHGGGVATLYAHMTRKAVSGGAVEQGQVIGFVGCTGSCTGPHLHFEVRVNGEPRNPRAFLP